MKWNNQIEEQDMMINYYEKASKDVCLMEKTWIKKEYILWQTKI